MGSAVVVDVTVVVVAVLLGPEVEGIGGTFSAICGGVSGKAEAKKVVVI